MTAGEKLCITFRLEEIVVAGTLVTGQMLKNSGGRNGTRNFKEIYITGS